MLILSWNCRGLRNASTVNSLRSFLRATKAHVGFITETKCDRQYSESMIARLGFQNFVVVPAEGLSGGIWFFWDDSINITIISFSKNLVHVRVGAHTNIPSWELLCFYGPPAHADRNQFWHDMIPLTTSITAPFLCVGDFNSITRHTEKRGGADFVASSVHGFNTWVADSGLIDLGYIGPAFTWENRQQEGHNIAERLDRAFGNGSWVLNFPNAGVMHLPRYNSDHNPILLKAKMNEHYRAPPPRFEAIWLRNTGFKDAFSNFWDNRASSPTLTGRLKVVLMDLKKWGAITFGSISKQIKECEKKLLSLQHCTPSDQVMNEEQQMRDKIIDLQKLEETFWLQRSRVHWINEGDKNTQFFHLSALNRKRRNTIASLILPNGNWTHDILEITNTLIHHFRSASKAIPITPIPDNITQSLPKISERENGLIAQVPTKEEITSIIREIGARKSPGPDGLPALFFHSCWEVVGEEVTMLIQNFFISNVLPDALNHTFLVLLPKKRESFNPSDFRPISLCNVLYKLITKILTVRIRPLLSRLVSPFQNAFVPGRQITDNLVLAQELIHSITNDKANNCSFALKLDMAKAYDRVSWPFLSQVLHGFGLTGHTHDIIMACVTSPTFSVMVNGSPQGFFAAERGLRQGCPLSPYLFILCSEILSQVTLEADRNQRYKGLQIKAGAPSISHLLFADDLFFFGKATLENAIGVRNILNQYESFSGQKVNFDKSSMFISPRLDPIMGQLLFDILGVKKMERTDKYLGKQILLPAARISSYADLIDRCTRKLAAWKANALSHAGRMVLLKSSLASIPIYSMGTSLLPKGVSMKLQQLQRQFWWGSNAEKKKMCLIKWETISKPKKEGGLGVRDPELVNLSLISKLVWRFLTIRDSHWSKILTAKYLRKNSFWDVKKPHICSPIWKSMIHCRDLIKPGTCWTVGDGKNIHIWHDPWVISLPGFRVVCKVGVQTDITWVADLILDGTRSWNSPLIQNLFEPLTAAAIERIELSQTEMEDKLLWIPHSKGNFSAKSMYKHLTTQLPSSSNSHSNTAFVNWSGLWQVKGIAPRVLMFLWRVLHGGVAVGAKLNRILGTNGTCKECKQQLETIDHMLLHCCTAAMVWQHSGLLTGLQLSTLSIPRAFTHLFQKNHDDFRHGCAIIWTIWIARNKKIFNEKPMDVHSILHQALKLYKDYKNPTDATLNNSSTVDDHALSRADVKWILPPEGYIKINVDGAHSGGLSAAGAIARNSQGRFLGGMAKGSFPGLPIEAEAQGLLLALELVNSLNLTHIIIESDSKILVDAISDNQSQADWRIVNTLNVCREFKRERPGVLFKFIPREANKAADVLATFALNHDMTMSWNGGLPPPFLLDVLFADLAHIVTTDVINE